MHHGKGIWRSYERGEVLELVLSIQLKKLYLKTLYNKNMFKSHHDKNRQYNLPNRFLIICVRIFVCLTEIFLVFKLKMKTLSVTIIAYTFAPCYFASTDGFASS